MHKVHFGESRCVWKIKIVLIKDFLVVQHPANQIVCQLLNILAEILVRHIAVLNAGSDVLGLQTEFGQRVPLDYASGIFSAGRLNDRRIRRTREDFEWFDFHVILPLVSRAIAFLHIVSMPTSGASR
jgi:hypothetical protein